MFCPSLPIDCDWVDAYPEDGLPVLLRFLLNWLAGVTGSLSQTATTGEASSRLKSRGRETRGARRGAATGGCASGRRQTDEAPGQPAMSEQRGGEERADDARAPGLLGELLLGESREGESVLSVHATYCHPME